MTTKPTLRQGSQGPNVALMQKLLNTIPLTLIQRLVEDGLFGRQTLNRVLEFQKNAKLIADGVVGPKSWAMLDELTRLLLPLGGLPGATPGVDAWQQERFRQAVLQIALAEALPVSNVSDRLSLPVLPGVMDPPILGKEVTKTPNAWRFGWPRLKQYYDEAVIGVNPNFWRQTGTLKVAQVMETIRFLDGVRGVNWRVPDATGNGLQWCGIFATWCWMQAGVPTKWPFGGPPVGIKKRAFGPQSPLPKPGDMLVQGGNLVHHSLLLPDDAGSKDFLVVNGNSDFQGITIKPIARSSVVAVYSLEDFQ